MSRAEFYTIFFPPTSHEVGKKLMRFWMDEAIKKALGKIEIECIYGRLYVFAKHQKTGDKYRFSFSHFNRTGAHLIAKFLRDRNCQVTFWSKYYADPT